jgi:hypothetical protein
VHRLIIAIAKPPIAKLSKANSIDLAVPKIIFAFMLFPISDSTFAYTYKLTLYEEADDFKATFNSQNFAHDFLNLNLTGFFFISI